MGPTPTPTSSLTSARGSSRGSRRVRRVQLATSRTRTTILADLSADSIDTRAARFSSRGSSRGCPLGMRACTRVNVYCTRSAIVCTFTKLHDRRIPVGVGVGPMEFKLNQWILQREPFQEASGTEVHQRSPGMQPQHEPRSVKLHQSEKRTGLQNCKGDVTLSTRVRYDQPTINRRQKCEASIFTRRF